MANGNPKNQTRGHKKRARTRQSLISAGTEAYASHGSGLTVQHVVDIAGVSHGTFYNYFSDLDALVEAVVVGILSGVVETIADRGCDDPARRFTTATLFALDLLAQNPAWVRVLLRLLARPGMKDILLSRMSEDLQEGMETGRFSASADEVGGDLVAGMFIVCLLHINAGQWSPDLMLHRVQRLLIIFGLEPDEAAQLVAEEAPPRRTP